MNPIDRLMLAVQLGDLREASSDLLTTPTDEEFVELLNVALTEQHWRVALQLVHAAPRSCLAREEGAGSLSLAIHRHAPPWVLRSLLSAGVRADLKACGSTPLHAAAARAGLETLRLLLDAGADIETRDISGLSPALVALGKRRLDTLAFLLTQGASVEAEHALTVAISRDSAESVKDLAQGRDLNVADRFGATPLHYAMSIRRPAIVELLLTLGADPELVDDTGNNSLGVAALWATPSVFEVLIRAGTRLDHANKWGNTPLLSLLLYASGEISSDSLACIESLVSAGAAVAPAGFGASDDCALVRTVTAHGGFRDSHARCLALLL